MPDEPDPTSPVSPLAPYPIPPTEHRSRAPEFYGFVVLTTTYILFCIFLLWALLPDEYILWLGVEWYPSREWAVLLPAYSIVLVLLTYFCYFALAIAGTPSFSDPTTITDSKAHYPEMTSPDSYLSANPRAIPDMYDIPICTVNRVLYGRTRDKRRKIASSSS